MKKIDKETINLFRDPRGLWTENPYDFWGEPILDSFFKSKGFRRLGKGTHRAVFALSKRHVIKVPINSNGVLANLQEVRYSRHHPHLVARSRLFGMSSIQLRMDKIFFFQYWEFPKMGKTMQDLHGNLSSTFQMKKWRDRRCLQAGVTYSGKTVAYDFNSY